MQSILAARLYVGGDGAGVVVRLHHDQPWTKDHQKGEYMLLPSAVDDDATFCQIRGAVELNFFYAHSRNPAGSLSNEDIGEAALGSASSHTQTSGVLLSPVSLQMQTKRPGLRTAKRVFFIVPPWRSRQAQPYARACVRGSASCTDHRFGRGETAVKDHCSRAHSQVVCCDEL